MNRRIIVLIALAAVVFSIPAGAEMNETQDGGGGNGTYPPGWNETPTPVVTATAVPEPTPEPEETPTAVPPPVETPTCTVQIRGEVVDAAIQIAPFIWTGQNFAGLYYDVDRNLMSDSLTSTVTVPDTIESGDLAYTAYRAESCYKNPDIGEYFAIGWFGERCMAVNGKPYLVSPIIFEMGKSKKMLATGDEWNLGNGYSLVVMWIDLGANEVSLSLLKDGAEVASSVIQPHDTGDWFGNCMYISGFPGAYTVTMWDVPTTSTFVYQEDVGLEADVPIFSVYVDAIFRGTVTNVVQLKYAMLIDDDPVSVIETGAGMMGAETIAPESVRLVNSENIDLRMDSDTGIAGDLRIRVADDRDGNGVANYRYYPYVNRACPAPDPEPTPTPTPTPHPTDGPVEIRGEVMEPAGLQTGDIVWNASNFAAFWYDLDRDLMTETLRIASGTLSDYDRTIEEREIEFDYSEWGKYNVTSFMAETYFTGYSANTSGRITGETISLVSNGMLSKVLIDEDNTHTISTGASLELLEGYGLKVLQPDVDGGNAQIELLWTGCSVDIDVVKVPATYVYTRDLGAVDDVPLIAIHVNSIYSGTETDMIVVKGIFQISEDYICDRTIEEREIEYVTETMESDFDYSGWEEYDAMSFMAETYFAGYSANTSDDITDETVSLVSNGMLSKAIVDESDKHTISTGASLELPEGYALKLIQLDASGDTAQIELFRNGKSVDTGIISNTPATYVYTRDLGKVDNVPLIAIHVNSIHSGTERDMIVINGIFQISENYISINPGDNYDEMEIVSISSDPFRVKKIRMENYNDIDLSEGETIDLMGDIKLSVADNETLRFTPVAELTKPGTYEVRGAVQRQDGNQSAEIVWNASNFAAFWYEIDNDVATETLEIAPGTLSALDRTIDEGDLMYATHPIYREYGLYENEELTVDGHEGYLVEGWVGRQCVAINGRADKLCELLVEFEDDDTKTLATGEAWALGGGFTLTARQIDLYDDKVWFSLYKDGKELDSEIVLSGGVYTYTPDIGGEDDVPVFTCYVDAVFRGTDSNIVPVKYVFLIDDDVLELGTGDRFGCMEVVTASSDEVTLKNDDAIDLDSGTTIQIMDGLYFKTADDSVIRFYPFVKRIIGGAVPPEVGAYIFDSELNVNEGIVIENSINIDVVGVGTGMGNYAKFRISSYQKPTRTVMIYQGDIPTKYDTQFGDSIYIDVTGVCRNDSVRFRVTGPENWRVTEYYVVEPAEEPISDGDGDGVPDLRDKEPDTPRGYWVNSQGIGRKWGDMNGDGKLTSVDALMIMQAAVGNLKDPVTGCNDLDQRVLRMYDQDEDGQIDADWMDAASIDLELNRILPSEYDQVKYAYEYQCLVEPAE